MVKQFLFSVNWVVQAEAIPRGMGDLLLYDTGDLDLEPLLVQQNPVRRAASKTEDESARVVTAGLFVPATARDLGEGYLKLLASAGRGFCRTRFARSTPKTFWASPAFRNRLR